MNKFPSIGTQRRSTTRSVTRKNDRNTFTIPPINNGFRTSRQNVSEEQHSRSYLNGSQTARSRQTAEAGKDNNNSGDKTDWETKAILRNQALTARQAMERHFRTQYEQELTDIALQIYAAKCHDIGKRTNKSQRIRFCRVFTDLCRERKFSLSKVGLGPRACKVISRVLSKRYTEQERKNSSSAFEVLDLSGNSIEDSGACEVGRMLRINNSLTSINLSSNSIEGPGFGAVFSALKYNSTVTSLDMSCEDIRGSMFIEHDGATGLQVMLSANRALTRLNLQNCGIGLLEHAVHCLSQGIAQNESLVYLNLSSNRLSYRHMTNFGASLAQNNSLECLYLANNRLGSSGAGLLSEVLRVSNVLRVLDLSKNKISSEGFALLTDSLHDNSSLVKLTLDHNPLGRSINNSSYVTRLLQQYKLAPKSISAHLTKALGLKSLSLRSCNLTDAFLTKLCTILEENEILTRLSLRLNLIKDAGAKALAKLLTNNLHLQSLDLSFNSIRDAGGAYLGRALLKTPSLTEIDLRDNELEGNAATEIFAALARNRRLVGCLVSGNRMAYPMYKKITEIAARHARSKDADTLARHCDEIKDIKSALERGSKIDTVVTEGIEIKEKLQRELESFERWKESEICTSNAMFEELRVYQELAVETGPTVNREIEQLTDVADTYRRDMISKCNQAEEKLRVQQEKVSSKKKALVESMEYLEAYTKALRTDDVEADRLQAILQKHHRQCQHAEKSLLNELSKVDIFCQVLTQELEEEEAERARSKHKALKSARRKATRRKRR